MGTTLAGRPVTSAVVKLQARNLWRQGWMSFRGRLTVSMLVLLLLVVLLLGSISVWQVQSIGQDDASRIEAASARVLAINIDFYYSEAHRALASVAGDTHVSSAVEDSNIPAVTHALDTLTTAHSVFIGTYMVTAERKVLTSSSIFGSPRPEAAFLQKVFERTRSNFYIGSPSKSSFVMADTLIIPMALSLSSSGGSHSLGVLIGEFSLQSLSAYVKDTLLARNGLEILLSDSSGNILYTSLPVSSATKPTPGSEIPQVAAQSFQQLSASRVYSPRSFTFVPEQKKMPYLATSLRLMESDWLLLLAQPEATALAPSRRLIGEFMLAALVIALVALYFSLQLGKLLSQPLQDLIRATQQIANGDYNLTIAPSGLDDTEQVAQSFRRMVRKIIAAQDELRQQNSQLDRGDAR